MRALRSAWARSISGVSYATRDDGGFVAMADDAGNESAVEDKAGQHDTWAVGVSYSDGPMTVSVDHMNP